eukprot:14216734-Alexandrium_andersonii.AAC.1
MGRARGTARTPRACKARKPVASAPFPTAPAAIHSQTPLPTQSWSSTRRAARSLKLMERPSGPPLSRCRSMHLATRPRPTLQRRPIPAYIRRERVATRLEGSPGQEGAGAGGGP